MKKNPENKFFIMRECVEVVYFAVIYLLENFFHMLLPMVFNIRN